nr:integrase, catalytic region, zinc finger, CCHC-type, peptidase aspartic, catalytic [Tanacetum cinerariifolium]
MEVKLWLGDDGSVDSLVSLDNKFEEEIDEEKEEEEDDLEYFDTFLTIEELGIKRYIDTKPNHELIHHCLKNPPYKFTWADKEVPISEGSPFTRTESYMKTYKTVSQDIRDQLNAEAEVVQIILSGIDNNIYSTVDACPNACEMWKAIERLKQGESINVQYLETNLYWEFRKFTSQDEPLQKVSTDDHYNVFAIESEHLEQSESIHDTYPIEQDEHNVIIDSLDMSYDREHIDQNNDDADLVNERELLSSLIKKLICEIDDSKNHNKFLETSNKVLIEKLKGEIEDFTNKNKSLESSNNRFKESNNKLSETNNLLYTDFKKSQAELARRNDVVYASKVKIDCAKARGDLISYKMESQKSFNKYTQTINDLNQTIFEMKEKLCAHQETISTLSQQKEAQLKLYKTCEDNELDKVIALENKVKVLDNIVYKTGQSVQTMNMLNNKCRTSFEKPEFLKKAQRANPRLYDIGVILTTNVSRPQLKSNRIEDRVLRNNSQGKKQDVEDHSRSVKFSTNKTYVIACNDSLKAKTLNVNFVCATCGKCVWNEKHDMCVLKFVNGMNSRTKMPIAMYVSTREPKCTVKQSVDKPLKKTVASESNHKPRNITRKLYERVSKACSWWYPKFTPSRYKWKPKSGKENVNPNLIEIVLFIVDSGCSKHMTGNLKLLINFVKKFLGTVKSENDQIAPILGNGDLVQGAVMIKRVYYVEGLNHNLFSVGQFCDADLEVAFRNSTCYIRGLKRNDLLTVIVDDYSRYTWTHFLRSKDETPKVIIDFLRLVQKGLQAQKGFFTKRPLLEHLNKMALSKDGTVHLLRLLEQCLAQLKFLYSSGLKQLPQHVLLRTIL